MGGTAESTARTLLRVDAAGEVVLGVALVAGAVGGVPAPEIAVRAFGAGLLPFAGALWALGGRPRRGSLRLVAGVNALTAAALGGWLAARGQDFAAPGAATTLGTAAALGTLAAAQARTARSLR